MALKKQDGKDKFLTSPSTGVFGWGGCLRSRVAGILQPGTVVAGQGLMWFVMTAAMACFTWRHVQRSIDGLPEARVKGFETWRKLTSMRGGNVIE